MGSGDRKARCAAVVETCDVTAALASTDIDTTPSTVGVSDILKDLMLEPTPVVDAVKLPDAALKDADTEKKAIIANIPTPGRRRSPLPGSTPLVEAPTDTATSAPVAPTTLPCLQAPQRGPTPWDMPADSGSQSQRYRDQLRVSGQQALQRAWDRGMVPKGSGSTSGASTPSSSANPLVLSVFDQLTTTAGQQGIPSGCTQMGPPPAQMGPQHFQGLQQQQQQHQQQLHLQYQQQQRQQQQQQHQHQQQQQHQQQHQQQQQPQQQQQHAFFQQPQAFFQPQPVYYQPQQAYFVPQANSQMVGCQASGPMMSPPAPCHDPGPFSLSPTAGFDISEAQMAEMLRHASEDVYED